MLLLPEVCWDPNTGVGYIQTNALWHHFDDGADSESLLKYAHTAEQEPSSSVAQQSVAGTQPDKLDQFLAQLKDFNVRVQELERKCSYGDSPLPMGVQHPTAPVSATVVPPVVSSGPGVIPLVGPSSEVEVKVEGKSCQALLDTGAMVTTTPYVTDSASLGSWRPFT